MKSLAWAGALLLAATGWGAQEQPYEQDEHTVLLLHMDERGSSSAADASRSRLKADLMPAPRLPLWEPAGMFGGCLRFDGVNADKDGDGRGDADALWLRDEGELQPGEGLTVEAWIKPDRVEGNQGIITRSGGGAVLPVPLRPRALLQHADARAEGVVMEATPCAGHHRCRQVAARRDHLRREDYSRLPERPRGGPRACRRHAHHRQSRHGHRLRHGLPSPPLRDTRLQGVDR